MCGDVGPLVFVDAPVCCAVWIRHRNAPEIPSAVFLDGSSGVDAGRIGMQFVSGQCVYTEVAFARIDKPGIVGDFGRVVWLGIRVESEKDIICKVSPGVAPVV
ncbi:MAG: hypothetical protein CEE38_05100 [Planctomycetes bacterium B3_Pla]|nr:MAG: hypothetical protein CEE38_05100 [Planctomycetes bacterium B3_Pla]